MIRFGFAPYRAMGASTKRKLWIVSVTMMIGLFILKALLFSGVVAGNVSSRGIPSSDVGFFSQNKDVGGGYYPELARSFSNGHLYLDLALSPQLLSHPNPYSNDAMRQGVIIQDASFFQGRYYLYYGVGPIIAIYWPIYWLTGAYPSDALVMCLLGMFYSCVLLSLLVFVSRKSSWVVLPALCCGLVNPVLLKSIVSMPTVHGVSRLFASTCVVAAAYMLLRFWRRLERGAAQSEIPPPWPRIDMCVLSSSLFISLAIATRPTAFPDLVALTALLVAILWSHRSQLRGVLIPLAVSYIVPITLTTVTLGWYNWARFGSAFEFGQKYVTQGLDVLNGVPMIRPPSDFVLHIANLAYKIYEYLLVFPVVQASSVTFRMGTESPFIVGAYSEGAVGLLAWAPALLLLPAAIWRVLNVAGDDGFSKVAVPYAFLVLSLFCFGANFWLIANIPITAFHLCLEFLPRLALLFVGLCLLKAPELEVDQRHPIRSLLLILTVVFCVVGVYNDHLF